MKADQPRSTDLAVVICAYTEGRWDDIVEAVSSLTRQSEPVGEIVLVIDHNEALEKRAQEQFGQTISVVANRHHRGLSGARNTGIDASTAPIVAFLDDDAVAEPSWAAAMISAYAEPAVLGVGGAVEPRWLTRRPRWWPAEFDWVVGCSYVGLPNERRAIRNPIGASMSVRRIAFETAGGFSPAIGRIGKHPVGCEETEFFIRAARELPETTVVQEPSARVSHKIPAARANFRYFRARCFAEGLSKAVVSKLASQEEALSSERNYTVRVLPLGVIRGLRDAVKGDLSGLGRAGAILLGLAWTTTGYVRGLRSPLPEILPPQASEADLA